MDQTVINGESVILVDAKFVSREGTDPVDAQFAIMVKQLGRCADRGESTAIAQFYGIVRPGLILPKHIFQGLERPLYTKGDMEGDTDKLVYSRKPTKDYVWSGDRFSGKIDEREPLADRTFVTIISPNRDNEKFPGIEGWIEHWNWVVEDGELDAAPIDWQERYGQKLWSEK